MPSVLALHDEHSLTNLKYARRRTRELLPSYIARSQGPDKDVTDKSVQSSAIFFYGRLQVVVGDGVQIIGAKDARRHKRDMRRLDWYFAAEVLDEDMSRKNVYYGKMLRFLRYRFLREGSSKYRDPVLAE
ncbi:unnamed protein product [Agarophyton chilense]